MDNITVVSEGKITQVIGPVVDVEFPDGNLPEIYDAVIVKDKAPNGDEINLTCEVQQLLGENRVRSVAMSSTDGLARGMKVINTGEPIKVPVGKPVLGRMFNLLGTPIDGLGNIPTNVEREVIHKKAPSFNEQDTSVSILETGIKQINIFNFLMNEDF